MINKLISLEEFKANLYELYDYSKKHYYENRPLTQHEKELLVKWGHVLIKFINTLTENYNFPTTIHTELHRMFDLLYTSVTPISMEYMVTHQFYSEVNDLLDDNEIKMIKNYLQQLKINTLHADPDLGINLIL